MRRPSIFVSTVSREFGTARQEIARVLKKHGYDPVFQDEFPAGHGNLLSWLASRIRPCAGLIQLTGDGYGAEPPQPVPPYGRISYTQYELLLALQLGKRVWVAVAAPDFPRDLAPDQLDRPQTPGEARDPDWQATRRRLQQEYVAEVTGSGTGRYQLRCENLLHYRFSSMQDLSSWVEKIHDYDAELRSLTERNWRRLAFTAAALFVILAGLAWGMWRGFQSIPPALPPVDPADVERQRLQEAAEILSTASGDASAAVKALATAAETLSPASRQALWEMPAAAGAAAQLRKTLATKAGYQSLRDTGAAEELLRLFPGETSGLPPVFAFPLQLLHGWRSTPAGWRAHVTTLLEACGSDPQKQADARQVLEHLAQMLQPSGGATESLATGFSRADILAVVPLLAGARAWLGDSPLLGCAAALGPLTAEQEEVLIRGAQAGSPRACSQAAVTIFKRRTAAGASAIPPDPERLLDALAWATQHPPEAALDLEPVIRALIEEPLWRDVSSITLSPSLRCGHALKLSRLPQIAGNMMLRGDVHTALFRSLPPGDAADREMAQRGAVEAYLKAREAGLPGAARHAYEAILLSGGKPQPETVPLLRKLAGEIADDLEAQGSSDEAARYRKAAGEAR